MSELIGSLSVEERTKIINESLARMQSPEEAEKFAKARLDANWKDIGDVDWDDLDFMVTKCRLLKDKDSFDTALRVLEAIKKQVLDNN